MKLSIKFVNSTAYPGRHHGGNLYLDPAPTIDGITRAVRCGFWFHILRLVYVEVSWKPDLLVHYAEYNRVACGIIQGHSAGWPEGNLSSSEPAEVTCPACRAGLEAAGIGILTYELGHNETLHADWIKCRGCGLTSYLPQDRFHHFCGHCHVFHDDLWPPARKWWIENTPKVVAANGRRIPGAKVGIERHQ